MSQLASRMGAGLRWGFSFAAVFSAIGAISAIASPGALWRDYHLTLLELAALYFSCGAMGGLVFGLLRPFASTQLRAALVGGVVSVPVSFLAIFAFLPGVRVLSDVFLGTWLVCSLVAGPLVGAALWVRRPSNR